MDAIEFIFYYPKFIEEIEQVAKPEYQHIVQSMKETDPHDFITSDTWFANITSARGFVWTLFLQKINYKKVV